MPETKFAKGLGMSCLTVSDIKAAKKLFVDVLGLEMVEHAQQYNWMEFKGPDGGIIGVGEACGDTKPGVNATLSISVDNIEKAKATMETKGIKFTGDIMEIPGHVKLAPFVDEDGNEFFLAQKLN